MAIGMILVRRRLRHHQSAPDNNGTENIRQRFHRIRDERLRMPNEASREFHHRQGDVRGQPQKGGPETALQTILRHGEILSYNRPL